MMYKAPDVIKVEVNVEDVFASYGLQTGCPEDEFLNWQYTVPCEGTDDYTQVTNTYTGMGLVHQCYSTFNP